MVPGWESKWGKEGFHSRRAVFPFGQHGTCEQVGCLAGDGPLWAAYHVSRFDGFPQFLQQ